MAVRWNRRKQRRKRESGRNWKSSFGKLKVRSGSTSTRERASGKWGVVECYCMQCGKALQARYFNSELEALQYVAVKQVLGIAPVFDTCIECCQEKLMECA